MLKKILFFVLIGGFLTLIGPDKPRAETMIYGGAQMIVPGGEETEGIGGGMMFGVGQKIGRNLILWTNYEGIKTEEAKQQDNVYAGLAILSDLIINSGALKGGIFLLIEGGIQNTPDSPINFGSLINGGLYFRLSETTDLYIGGGYSGDVYSIDIGTVIEFWE